LEKTAIHIPPPKKKTTAQSRVFGEMKLKIKKTNKKKTITYSSLLVKLSIFSVLQVCVGGFGRKLELEQLKCFFWQLSAFFDKFS